jgi:hypothetical protein
LVFGGISSLDDIIGDTPIVGLIVGSVVVDTIVPSVVVGSDFILLLLVLLLVLILLPLVCIVRVFVPPRTLVRSGL